MNDAPPDSAMGLSLCKSQVGLRVHMCLCAELPAHRLHSLNTPCSPCEHTHVLRLLGITTHRSTALTNSDVGDYELLLINEVSSFLVFTFAKKCFALTKYSPFDKSCPDEGERAWPDCHPSGGRWLPLHIMAVIPTLPPTSLFVYPCSRQIICISCRMGSR